MKPSDYFHRNCALGAEHARPRGHRPPSRGGRRELAVGQRPPPPRGHVPVHALLDPRATPRRARRGGAPDARRELGGRSTASTATRSRRSSPRSARRSTRSTATPRSSPPPPSDPFGQSARRRARISGSWKNTGRSSSSRYDGRAVGAAVDRERLPGHEPRQVARAGRAPRPRSPPHCHGGRGAARGRVRRSAGPARSRGVLMVPGATAFTRTPWRPHSTAIERVSDIERGLGRAVGGVVRRGDEPADRSDVHDAPATLFEHHTRRRLRGEQRGAQVEREHRLRSVDREVDQPLPLRRARAADHVHEPVDRARARRDRRRTAASTSVLVPHVAHEADEPARPRPRPRRAPAPARRRRRRARPPRRPPRRRPGTPRCRCPHHPRPPRRRRGRRAAAGR